MPPDFIIRTSLPEDSGTLPKRAFDLELPVLVSAGVFWKWDGKRSEGATTGKFKNPSGVLGSILDIALDSAGFTAMSQWGGYPWEPAEYIELAAQLGPTWWSSMDLCCEPEIAGDPAEVSRRMWETTMYLVRILVRLDRWRPEGLTWLQDPMPVLQGWTPDDYCRHAGQVGYWLGRMGREWPGLVGVGSVCRRSVGGISDILDALDRELPAHVRLHFFGAESEAVSMLAAHPRPLSTDSMAWDLNARMSKGGAPSSVVARAANMERWIARQRDHANGPVQLRMRW